MLVRPAIRVVVVLGIGSLIAGVATHLPAMSHGDFNLLVRPGDGVAGAATPARVSRTVTPARQHVAAAVDRHADRQGIPRPIFHALVKRESGYNPTAVGPVTPYGRAYGPAQMLCATARGLGEADCSRLTRDPDRAIELGSLYFRQGYVATGSWHGAASYYHGGPDKRLHGRKTRAYAAAVAGTTFAPVRLAYNVAALTANAPVPGDFALLVRG